MTYEDIPAGCYTPEHWLMVQGKEPLPEGFGDFGGFGNESENDFSPFQAAKTDKLPPFPEPCLPAPLWDMTAAMAENLQTAGDMFGTNLLAACAICLQGKFSINPKSGWMEPLNLYTVTIARPSERKSPALRVIAKPIKDFEIEKNQERKPLIDEWNSQKRLLSGKLKRMEKGVIEGKKWASEEKVMELQAAYAGLLRALLNLQDDNGKPRIIHLSPEAHQEAKAYAEALEPRLNGDLEFIEGWAGKLHGQIMRIAGILHCCKYLEESDKVPVELDTMQRAETIGNYFLEHAIAAFRISGLADDQATKDAKYILKRLDSTGKREISKRDLWKLCKDRVGMETADKMEPGLEVLVKRGYIKIEKALSSQNPQNPRKGGRPSWVVYLTPAYIDWKQQQR